MSLRLIVRSEAEADLAGIVRWYEEKQAGLGRQFAEEAGQALKRALGNPRAYRLMRDSPRFAEFSSTVFRIESSMLRDDALVVFAVIHGKRKEATWTDRVREH